MNKTLAERMAEYAIGLKYEDLPAEVVHEVKRRVIDSLGCALGAWRAEPCEVARRVASTISAERGATLLGTRHRTAPPPAPDPPHGRRSPTRCRRRCQPKCSARAPRPPAATSRRARAAARSAARGCRRRTAPPAPAGAPARPWRRASPARRRWAAYGSAATARCARSREVSLGTGPGRDTALPSRTRRHPRCSASRCLLRVPGAVVRALEKPSRDRALG